MRNQGNATIDEIDLEIIKMLSEDGRIPFTQIAKQLGVSTGMIRQRYHRLVENNLLQVVAVTNPMLMGYAIMAQIGVKVDGARLEEIGSKPAAKNP